MRNAYVCRCLLIVHAKPTTGLAPGQGLASDGFPVMSGGAGGTLSSTITTTVEQGDGSSSSSDQPTPVAPAPAPGLAQGPGLSAQGVSLFGRVAALQDIQSSLTRYVTR